MSTRSRTALISGGSKGIGLAIKNELESNSISVIDWSRTTGFNLMKEIPKDFPKVDILINNVGGMGRCSVEDYFEAMKKNYGIAERLTQKFIDQFYTGPLHSYPEKLGRVITISSIFGKQAGNNPGFTAAKAAQIAYMKCLANAHRPITFNTICPGYIDVGKDFGVSIESRFIGKPKDVAKVVAFLCSEDAAFISGACIVVDGGYSSSY